MKLRFTLRDLLWLVLVIALLMIWLLDRSRLSQEIVRQKEEIGRLQVDVLHATAGRINESMETMMRGYMDRRVGTDEAQRTDQPED